MKINDILRLLNVDLRLKNIEINKFKMDSRCVEKRDVFIDISGNKKYIKDSLKRGAILVITCINYDNKRVVKVDNIIDTIGLLSKAYKDLFNCTIIGITGSVGKTTTKELIYEILNTKYKVLKSKGNNNNHIGVPITLFNLNSEYDFCVVEMGMNHKGEIGKLSNICNPDIGIITNVGTSHIGNLGSIKNILNEKLEIMSGMNDKKLIVNGDNRFLKKVKVKKILIGTKEYNDFKCDNVRIENEKLYFDIGNEEYCFNIPNKGLINDVLIAIYIGYLYNIDIKDIKRVLLNYKGKSGRSNIRKIDNTIIIDDTYNASKESIISGLQMVKEYNKKAIIVLGDIKEIDGFENKIYKKINNKLKYFEEVLLVGKNIKNIKGKYKYFDTLNELYKYIKILDLNNKLVYFKASHSVNLEKVVDLLINDLENK